MRLITLTSITVAFLATSSAKWSFGDCDQSIEGWTYEDFEAYNDDDPAAETHIHKV
jgi:hypothetical protein